MKMDHIVLTVENFEKFERRWKIFFTEKSAVDWTLSLSLSLSLPFYLQTSIVQKISSKPIFWNRLNTLQSV